MFRNSEVVKIDRILGIRREVQTDQRGLYVWQW